MTFPKTADPLILQITRFVRPSTPMHRAMELIATLISVPSPSKSSLSLRLLPPQTYVTVLALSKVSRKTWRSSKVLRLLERSWLIALRVMSLISRPGC